MRRGVERNAPLRIYNCKVKNPLNDLLKARVKNGAIVNACSYLYGFDYLVNKKSKAQITRVKTEGRIITKPPAQFETLDSPLGRILLCKLNISKETKIPKETHKKVTVLLSVRDVFFCVTSTVITNALYQIHEKELMKNEIRGLAWIKSISKMEFIKKDKKDFIKLEVALLVLPEKK